MKKYKISIITATFNAMAYLPRLVESLRNQDDKDFEWVVADGSSTDGTLAYLKSIDDLIIKIVAQEDFGIYDAINRGIKACSGEFYLVMGADDILYPNAIADYKVGIERGGDVITAVVNGRKKVYRPGGRWPCIFGYGTGYYVSAHSVGAVFKVSLHKDFGYYSKKYPIAADQLFIIRVGRADKNIVFIDRTVGEFGDEGVSSSDLLGSFLESYRVRIETGQNKLLQTFIFILRLVKNYNHLLNDSKYN